jgi:hypothetical protein
MPKTHATPASAKNFVAHFSTSDKVAVVEEWLQRHVTGGWKLRTEGVSDDLLTKSYQLVFAEQADHAKFRSHFAPARATRPSQPGHPQGKR